MCATIIYLQDHEGRKAGTVKTVALNTAWELIEKGIARYHLV